MISEESRAAYVNAQAVAAQCEMQAMIAENASRAAAGKAQAYGEDEFISLIETYGLHTNALIQTLGS